MKTGGILLIGGKWGGNATGSTPYSHSDEAEALNTFPGGDCISIKWAIKVLEANIAWRISDLNPQSSSYKSHLKRIKILKTHLRSLKSYYTLHCGGC
jgi:hypothetical protein